MNGSMGFGRLASPLACCVAIGAAFVMASGMSGCGDAAERSATGGSGDRGSVTQAAMETPESDAAREGTGGAVGSDATDATGVSVISISPTAVDVLLDLGLEPALVPRMPGSQPERWAGLETMQMTHAGGPELEAVASTPADVIFTQPMYERFTPGLVRVNPAQVVSVSVESVEDVHVATLAVGEAVGLTKDAEALVDQRRAMIGEFAAGVDQSAEPVTVLAMMGGGAGFYAVKPESYLGDLIRMLGGELITEDLTESARYGTLAQIGLETVVAKDPDVIIMLDHAISPVPASQQLEKLQTDPAWAFLRAVRAGRVSVLPDDLYLIRPGAEVERAVTELAASLTDGVLASDRAGDGDGESDADAEADAASLISGVLSKGTTER